MAASSSPSTSLLESTFLSIDIETTGLDPKVDHITEVGWALFRSRVCIETGSFLCKPEKDSPKISDMAQALTGITPKMLEKAAPFAQGILLLHQRSQMYQPKKLKLDFIVEYSGRGFDREFLTYHAERALGKGKLFFDGVPWVDACVLVRSIERDPSLSYKLSNVIERYEIKMQGNAHRALPDALATGELMCKLLPTFLKKIKINTGHELASYCEGEQVLQQHEYHKRKAEQDEMLEDEKREPKRQK